MNRYLHPAMKQLTDQQVRFAPQSRRQEQLDRAEQLLLEVEPSRSYPYQVVCQRLTEYKPNAYPDLVLSGEELRHDLRQFIDDVSASLDIPMATAGEPVLSIDEVSDRYHVSTKTVNRWRERGLISRRFIVDGRRRVGFLQSSVERFVGAHSKEVERSTRFSQLSDEEKDEIVRRARRMGETPLATLAEVSRRIARRLGRSTETVRYTIKNWDRDHPDRAIFPSVRGPVDEPTRNRIFRSYRRGMGVEQLAEKFRRTRSTVYRIVNEMRAEKVRALALDHMAHPSFDEASADAEFLGPTPAGDERAKNVRPPSGLPPYLQSLYGIPLLTREQEHHLFRKMNYLLHKAQRARDSMDVRRLKASQLDDIERWASESAAIKREIIRANLRLVVSIAKRHVSATGNLFELISDGNISLIRAVEKFDFSRGFKFSTYASWAIMKNFARTIPAESTRRDRFVTGHETTFDLTADRRSDEHEIEDHHDRMQSAVDRILDRLNERERQVITYRYGLGKDESAQTLEQVGSRFGVTKERIRQIEAAAISKLRKYATEDKLDVTFLN